MKRYLLYLLALIWLPMAAFGQTRHLKVDMEPKELSEFFLGASILIIQPNGGMDFVGETEGDIPVGSRVRIYPMLNFEGFSLVRWKENGSPTNIEIKTSEWGEVCSDYVMPDKDVVLTAVYSNGSDGPDNPPLQDAHKFIVSTGQDGGGYIGNVLHKKNGKFFTLSVNQGNGVSKGDTILIDVQPSNYYKLKEWKENDVVKQLQFTSIAIAQYEGYYEYVMPDYDVNLVAYFEKYTHEFKVSADHYGEVGDDDGFGVIGRALRIKGGRTYILSVNGEEMSEGDTIHIYAPPYNEFWALKEWKENGALKAVPFTYEGVSYSGGLSYDGFYEYIMPAYDVDLVAYFEPAVPLPGNPGTNQIVGGTLVLNDFKPGGLSTVLPYDKTSFSSIVVMGDVREKDLSIANGTNATTLDLTRTYGFHVIPWSAFAGGSMATMKLEHILLPACIDSIASAAFDKCTSLKQLTILATTPPKLAYDALTSGLTVKVPQTSLALYKAAEGWKNLKIEAITEAVSDLTLLLPDDYTDGRYKNMSIELTNATTGETTKYIVTDRQDYTFGTLLSDTRYSASLKSSGGSVVASIGNIFMDNGNKTLAFADVRMSQEVTLTVMNAGWQDVTSDVEITWMDASGRFLGKGSTLGNVQQGTVLKYGIKLSEELAKEYVIPDVGSYQVKANYNQFQYNLKRIERVGTNGTVVSSGIRLQNASVKFLQTVNGKYTSITETTTDMWGEYSATVLNVPTTITVAANGYVVKSINKDHFDGQRDLIRLEAGADPLLTISYAYDYAESVAEGATSSGDAVFSDLANTDFKVYNSTKGKEVTELLNSYPQLMIYDGVEADDDLTVTVSSLTRKFMPVTISLKVGSEGQQSITIPLKQLGGIDASFASTTNAAVVGILYDSKQQFLQLKRYEDALLSIRELPDGTYTLVSMKEDDRYNTIQNLGQYSELGLREGEDYVRNDVNVVSGTITTIENEVIPASQLGDATYTNTNATYFAVSETKSAIDCYVTVRAKVEFNDAYAAGVTNPSLVVDIPEGCDFVDNSVIVGTKPVPYTYNERRLSVPLSADYDLVKFCILPKAEGQYRLGGNAQFSYGGKGMTEPVGTALFQATANGNLSLTIPPTITDSIFYANGTAAVASVVKIYVDGALHAQTTANAKGRWSAKCRLDNPANLSTHYVQAVAAAASGESSSSSVQTIMYDQNAVLLESVTMSHYNPEMRKTYTVDFEFNSESSLAPSYTVYWPKPDFTFSVKLSTVDSERICNMVLYTLTQRGDTVVLYPVFDPASQTWLASHTYQPISSNLDPPVNVMVSFDEVSRGDSPAGGVDREALNQVAGFFAEFQESVRKGMEEVMAINDDYRALLERGDATQEELDAITKRLEESLGVDFSAFDDNQMTDDELEAAIDSLMGTDWEQEYETLMNGYQAFIDGSQYDQAFGAITISHCDGLTEASLLEKGFKKIMTTGNTFVYVLGNTDEYAFVDFANDQYIRVDLTALNPDVANQIRNLARRRAEGESDPVFWVKQMGIVTQLSAGYDGLCNVLETVCTEITKLRTQNFEALKMFNQLNLNRQMQRMGYGMSLVAKSKALRFIDDFLNGTLRPFVKGTTIANASKALEKAPFWGQMLGGLFKSGMSVFGLVQDEINALNQMMKLADVKKSIPKPCEDDEAAAQALRQRIGSLSLIHGSYHVATIATDIECVLATVASLPLFVTPAFFVSVGQGIIDFCALLNALVVNPAMNKMFESDIQSCELELSLLECNKDKKKKDKIKKFKSNIPDAKVLIDPSGYVYEGVASNRLEGVMTTIFYRQEVEDVYGDKHQESVLWDAENYGQQNPLYTDKDGRYEWFVPQGMWQVKYEKDGYQTAYSEWLPVPPPQLDVNQAMVQMAQPEVTMAHCYPTGIEVEFSKYMKPATLNSDNIFLTHDGKRVSGKVIMLNEEKDLKGNLFASKARFVPDATIPVGDKVQFTVSRQVKSYADMMMPGDFSQEFTIEHEVNEIVADSIVRVTFGTDKKMVITATPVAAAVGKTLQVASGTAMIAATDQTEYVLDENGQAEITVKGLTPGSTALLFSIKDYSASALTLVEVLDPNQYYVAEPKASIASGSEVTKGQQIMLTCETPGAVIYYTLDGSCPCNDTPARQVYSGPITITDNVTEINAIAAVKDLGESDIATFRYHLHGYTGIDDLGSTVSIWPLVTRSDVNVDLGGQTARSISVVNTEGVRVFHAANVSGRLTIDFSHRQAGLYIIAVELPDGKVVKKIVKK